MYFFSIFFKVNDDLGHRFYDVLMINNVSYLQWLHLFQKAACQMDFLAIKIG